MNVVTRLDLNRWWLVPVTGVLVMLAYVGLADNGAGLSILYDGAALVCGLLVALGARRRGPGKAAPWYLLSCGVIMWALGDGIWSFYEFVLHDLVPFPSIADAVYLLAYPVTAAGLLRLVSQRDPGADRGALIDSAIVAVAVIVPAWVFLIEPYALDASLSLVYRGVSVAYPVADIVLVAVAVRLLISRGRRPMSFWLLTAGLVATLVADVWYAVALLEGTYYSGHPMDLLWIAYYLLIATAALHPSAGAITTVPRSRPLRARRPFALYLVAALIIPTTFLIAEATGRHLAGPLMAFGFLAICALMVARLRDVLRQVDSQVQLLEAQRSDLEASEARKSSIVESALDCIVGMDEGGRIVEFNPAAERLFGFRREEMLGKRLSHTLIPHRFRAGHEKGFSRLLAEGSSAMLGQRVEVFALRADGSEFPIELVATSSDDVRFGRTFTAFVRDMTPEMERRRLEEHLRQSQKMDAIGQLAGGVAHEFNNLLAVILSYTALVRSDLADSDPRREDLTEVTRAGNRAADLVRQLLAFSRKQMSEPEVLDPGEVVARMERLLRPLLGEDVSLSFGIEPGVHPIEMDPHQLEQVVTNLVVNARDAVSSNGRIEVLISNEHRDGRGFVAVRVVDDGCGIEDEIVERVFEPFFTTKPHGKGTGLGLSMVYGSVVSAGGSVSLETSPGRGTTFTVLLPASGSMSEGVARAEERDVEGGRGETVLVVEDEASVAAVVRRILERNGYRVIVAGGPEEGLAVMQSRAVDAVLSDVIMPVMSGPEMMARVGAEGRRPATVFMSGYPKDRIEERGTSRLETPLLVKPFTERELVETLKRALRTPPVPAGDRAWDGVGPVGAPLTAPDT